MINEIYLISSIQKYVQIIGNDTKGYTISWQKDGKDTGMGHFDCFQDAISKLKTRYGWYNVLDTEY